MRLFLRLLGLGFIIWGIYILGQNIIFTTNPYPYWWRGIAADGSIVTLMSGILILIFAPRNLKNLGFIFITAAIALVFMSSKAILNPTSLWQFVLSFTMIAGGYQTLITGRSPF